jgi:dienelactone hydrolase
VSRGTQRNFSPWAYWRLRLEQLRDVDPIVTDDAAAFAAWRDRARAPLDALLGEWPDPVPGGLEVLEADHDEGFVRQKIVFDSEELMSVPALLLVPDDRTEPGPAVLAIHGHGLGKDLLCGLDGGDATARAALDATNGDIARQLATRGFVVLAPDLRGFGERAEPLNPPAPTDGDLVAEIEHDQFVCGYELVCGAMFGVNPMTQNLWDLRCALDVLAHHPDVDEQRIGVAGWSYGGTLALLLGAIDARVRATVVSCFFSSWRSAHAVPWNMCGSQVLWGMLGQLEHVDVAALIAPRALCVESADADELFPVEAALDAMVELRRAYELSGATPHALVHDVFPGGHAWHGATSIDFLAAQL